MGMGKEVKISLAALALLLVVFVVVLARRLMGGSQAAAAPPATAARNVDDSPAERPLEPATVQPTLLETSPGAGRPPLSRMTPSDAGSAWKPPRPSEPEEIVPGASFMPKSENLEADAEPRFAARPRTFASTADRYDAAASEPETEIIEPAGVAEPKAEVIEPVGVAEPTPEPAVEISGTGPILPVSDGEPIAQNVAEGAAAPRELTPPMNQAAAVAPEVEAEPLVIASDAANGYRDPQMDASAPVAGDSATPPDAQATVPAAPALPPSSDPSSATPTPASAQLYRQSAQPSTPPARSGYAAGNYAAEPAPVAPPPAYGDAPDNAAPQVAPSVPAVEYEPSFAGDYGRGDSMPAKTENAVVPRQNTGVYYVEPGDSFWRISQKMYGTGGYFKALQAYNRDRFPNPADLNIGDEVATPTVEELRAKYSGLCPKERAAKPGTPQVRAVSTLAARATRPYVVEEGDTLYDIAKYELGDASRWPEIFQLNRDTLSVDIDYLRPGTKILLPADEEQPADMLTRQPDETLRR